MEILKKQELAKILIKEVINFTGFDGEWEDAKDRVTGQALYSHLKRNFKSVDFDDATKDIFF